MPSRSAFPDLPKSVGRLRKNRTRNGNSAQAAPRLTDYGGRMIMRLSLMRRGFTLVELLVVIAIVGILASLLVPALARSKQKVRQVSEVNAGRQLMLAWQLYSLENHDKILPGYTSQMDAVDHRGNPIGSPVKDRYPWRLAPQLANNFKAIYVNESRRFLEDAMSRSDEDYVYRASLYPSLGYNSVFLGGDDQKFNPALASLVFGNGWLALQQSQIKNPSSQLAFGSARSRGGHDTSLSKDELGFFSIHPPYLRDRQWDPQFDAARPPEKFGFVHPRWAGRFVAAMADGHAESISAAEVQDMRRWTSAADSADWTLKRQP